MDLLRFTGEYFEHGEGKGHFRVVTAQAAVHFSPGTQAPKSLQGLRAHVNLNIGGIFAKAIARNRQRQSKGPVVKFPGARVHSHLTIPAGQNLRYWWVTRLRKVIGFTSAGRSWPCTRKEGFQLEQEVKDEGTMPTYPLFHGRGRN